MPKRRRHVTSGQKAQQEVRYFSLGYFAVTTNRRTSPMHPDHRPEASAPQDCPIRNVLDRIGDQWSLLVLLTLVGGTHRFTELQRAIGDISKRMLAETLRKLERDGFVNRKVYPSVPPKVEYRLCPLGESLAAQLRPLVDWANQNQDAVRQARTAYQAPTRMEAL